MPRPLTRAAHYDLVFTQTAIDSSIIALESPSAVDGDQASVLSRAGCIIYKSGSLPRTLEYSQTSNDNNFKHLTTL